MNNLKLYNYFRSSSAYRVRIALNLKGIPYDRVAVHLLNNGGEQNSAEYRAVNPMAQVPTLVDGNFNLGQSMAIINYIDDLHPQPKLFPINPKLRARVIQLCEIINSGIQPLQNLRVLQELEARFGADAAAKENWSQFWIHRGLEGLEKLLKTTAGQFCIDNEPSAVDCFLVPQIFVAKRNNLNLEPFPIITKINQNCLALKSFIDAHPDNQPDSPKP